MQYSTALVALFAALGASNPIAGPDQVGTQVGSPTIHKIGEGPHPPAVVGRNVQVGTPSIHKIGEGPRPPAVVARDLQAGTPHIVPVDLEAAGAPTLEKRWVGERCTGGVWLRSEDWLDAAQQWCYSVNGLAASKKHGISNSVTGKNNDKDKPVKIWGTYCTRNS